MKILFRDIGRIKTLDFELKKGLTLFCGKNGTGKTYAAYVIFSILNRFESTSPKWISRSEIANLFAQGNLSVDLKKISESAPFLKDLSKKLAQNLDGDFDAPKDFFGKDSVAVGGLPLQLSSTTKGRAIKAGLEFGNVKITLVISNGRVVISLVKSDEDDSFSKFPQDLLSAIINEQISTIVARRYLARAFVLTAERAAINLFSRELSSSRNNLVDQLLALENSDKQSKKINIAQFVGQKASRYSLPIRKGLEIAEDLKNIAKEKGEFAAYADKLEDLILGGKIQIGENGELAYIHNQETSLRINLAASMVKSLASLVVYLRHQAAKGDLLIIDEPELNLHPESQRKVARFLCELTNAGLDILISTHSDYIVREVNNAILLKHPSMQNVKTKHGYLDEQLIAPDRVSVVLFREDGNAEQLTVDGKGFAVDSIDDEIDLLNRIAEDIEQEWLE